MAHRTGTPTHRGNRRVFHHPQGVGSCRSASTGPEVGRRSPRRPTSSCEEPFDIRAALGEDAVMDAPWYLYSEVVPRVVIGPSLGSVPPRLIRAAQRYDELLQTFHAMTKQVKKAPVITARVADLDGANPPLTFDLEDVLP